MYAIRSYYARLGVNDRDQVVVASPRGEVRVQARVTDMVVPGVVFMPFHFAEGAANALTNNVLDPESAIPRITSYNVCYTKLLRMVIYMVIY